MGRRALRPIKIVIILLMNGHLANILSIYHATFECNGVSIAIFAHSNGAVEHLLCRGGILEK